jgi:hypothetical protein
MNPTDFLRRYSVPCVFHFTDARNIPLIRQHGGLFSLAELRRRGIEPAATGGNDWSHEADARVGMDEYVHLCLFNEHPMEFRARQDGRIRSSKFLQIQPAVLHCDGIRFTQDVSNKAGVRLLTLEEAAQTLDFSVVYDRTDWRDPKIQERRQLAKKYELLVPSHIPLTLFHRI